MDTDQYITHYNREIIKAQHDAKRLIHCLSKLFEVNITRANKPEASAIFKTVERMCFHNSNDVKSVAQNLHSRWMSLYNRGSSSKSVNIAEPSKREAGIAPNTSKKLLSMPILEFGDFQQQKPAVVRIPAHIETKKLQSRPAAKIQITSSSAHTDEVKNQIQDCFSVVARSSKRARVPTTIKNDNEKKQKLDDTANENLSNAKKREVSTLFDLCIKVCKEESKGSCEENFVKLSYPPKMSTHLVHQILANATPMQLRIIEHRNPDICRQTDKLWQTIVKNKFRRATRKESESYRNMYQRCMNMQANKLQSLSAVLSRTMQQLAKRPRIEDADPVNMQEVRLPAFYRKKDE